MRRKTVASLLIAVLLGLPLPARAQAGIWRDALPAPENAISYMSAFPTGEMFVFFHVRPDSLYKSSDFGLTWQTLDGPPEGANGLEMASPEVGYVTSGGNIHRTVDGGTSWQRTKRVKLPGPRYQPFEEDFKGWDLQLAAVGATDKPQRITFGGELTHVTRETRDPDGTRCYSGPRSAVVLTSTDGAASGRMRITRLGFPGTVQRMGWLNRRVGWVLATEYRPPDKADPCYRHGVRYVVMVTRDGGATYDEVLECPCMSVAMSDPRTIVVGQSDGQVLVSSNRGKSFEPAGYLGPPGGDGIHLWWVNGIEFADEEVGYAVVMGGGTWRSEDGGRSWSFEASSQSAWGVAFGDVAVADRDHAIAGGPNTIVARLP